MKLLHTADWHAGRVLKGQSRTPEVGEALEEIASLAIEEQVDLILVAGDLYDKKNPGADAEAAVYRFFRTVSDAGIPSVVIAGNHDSPGRLDAVSSMLELAQTHVLGEAKVAGQGGAFQLQVGDEVAQIAALPFVSERRIVRYADLLNSDPGEWSRKYREGMQKLIANLSKDFSPEKVNLLLLHTAMDGATLANSEYVFHCTSSYSLGHESFPDRVNYVALGHIHKPQPVSGFNENVARYSGSLLQLDFGEVNDTKYAYIVDARAGQPTELVKAHEIKAGKELKHVRLNTAKDDWETKLMNLEEYPGWLKISLKLDKPRPGLKDRIKTWLPNALGIEFEYPGVELEQEADVDVDKIDLKDAYAQFYEAQRGKDLPQDLLGTFEELLAEGFEDDEALEAA